MNKTKHLLIFTFIFPLLTCCTCNLFAQKNTAPGSHYKGKHANKGTSRYSSSTSSGTVKTENTEAANDSIANQKKGSAAKTEFMKKSGHPFGWPGYVLDYIVPLDKGGCDCVSNMQWITIEAAKAQGKLE
jgi:hypothetical protein